MFRLKRCRSIMESSIKKRNNAKMNNKNNTDLFK